MSWKEVTDTVCTLHGLSMENGNLFKNKSQMAGETVRDSLKVHSRPENAVWHGKREVRLERLEVRRAANQLATG